MEVKFRSLQLGTALRALRKHALMNLEELSLQLEKTGIGGGFSPATINRLERGTGPFSEEVVDAIRSVFTPGGVATDPRLLKAFNLAFDFAYLGPLAVVGPNERLEQLITDLEENATGVDYDSLVLKFVLEVRASSDRGEAPTAFFDAERLHVHVMYRSDIKPSTLNEVRNLMLEASRCLSTPLRAERLARALEDIQVEVPVKREELVGWYRSLDQINPRPHGFERFASVDKLAARYREEGWSLVSHPCLEGTFIHNEQLDKEFASDTRPEIRIGRLISEKFRLSPAACKVAPYALNRAFANTESLTFNAEKVRLSEDFTLTSLIDNQPITLQRTDYYSAIVTNGTAWKQYIDKCDGTFFEGNELTTESDFWRDLYESRCANMIGINVLVATSDDYLLIQTQNAKNGQGKNQRVPTGSGSVEWIDTAVLTSSPTMEALLVASGTRELVEESGIRHDSIIGMWPIGYTVDLQRGFKPDFFYFCRINQTASEVKGIEEREDLCDRQEGIYFKHRTRERATAAIDSMLKGDKLNQFLVISLLCLQKRIEDGFAPALAGWSAPE